MIYVLSVTANWHQQWHSCGATRQAAIDEANNAAKSGNFQRPIYRVIVTPKR